jgi:tRNA 2-thiouridine synthesizing protein C
VTRKRFLLVCRQPPYGSPNARAALDVAMAAAAFDQPVALLFLGDGAAQLLRDQNADAIGEKSFEKQLAALPLYDVDELYVDAEALRRLGLTEGDLALPAQPLAAAAIAALLARFDVVLNF